MPDTTPAAPASGAGGDPSFDEENPENLVATFQTLSAEGDLLAQRGSFAESIQVFTRALNIRPGDKHCLVSRSKCYIQVGSPRLALEDAEESLKDDPKFFKGLFQKAEALYAMGDFELALMYYHRGNRLRPELQEFRIGIQKSREAIENSIGHPKEHKIKVPEKLRKNLAAFLIADPFQVAKGPGGSRNDSTRTSNIVTRENTSYLPPSTHHHHHHHHGNNHSLSSSYSSKPSKTSLMESKLLGELYEDKCYLSNLISDKDFVEHPDPEVMNLVNEGLRYLTTRLEFWRQQNPLYARPKGERIRPRLHQKSAKPNTNKTNEKDAKQHVLSAGTSPAKTAALGASFNQLSSIQNQARTTSVMKDASAHSGSATGVIKIPHPKSGDMLKATSAGAKRELAA
jgi:tetratricopeptide (TPR) repeat protein